MAIVSDRPPTVHAHAADWPAWTDDDCWTPTEEDAQWWAEQNEEWHDLDGHPTIDDDDVEVERQYQAQQQRRYAADPTDDDIDRMADEAAFMAAYEMGLTFF
jgi:hypothetical protein